MNRKHGIRRVFSIVGLIIVLGMALGSDALTTFLRRAWLKSDLSTILFQYYTSYIFTALLLAAVSLLLFWFLLNRTPRDIWVALLFLLTGLFFVVYPVLYYIPNFLPTLPPQLGGLLANPRSYIVYSGAVIAMMGIFALALPREKGENL